MPSRQQIENSVTNIKIKWFNLAKDPDVQFVSLLDTFGQKGLLIKFRNLIAMTIVFHEFYEKDRQRETENLPANFQFRL